MYMNHSPEVPSNSEHSQYLASHLTFGYVILHKINAIHADLTGRKARSLLSVLRTYCPPKAYQTKMSYMSWSWSSMKNISASGKRTAKKQASCEVSTVFLELLLLTRCKLNFKHWSSLCVTHLNLRRSCKTRNQVKYPVRLKVIFRRVNSPFWIKARTQGNASESQNA